MPQLLLIEDDETITLGLSIALRKKQYDLVCASTIEEGKASFTEHIDLIVLDLNLPDGSGYELCTYFKSIRDVPVIFLTVRDEETDIVKGLDMGADDYVIKPFQLNVLFSRIQAVLRRSARYEQAEDTLRCGSITLDKRKTSAYCDQVELPLTAMEYRLLVVLLENKNQTLTRLQLLDRLWDTNSDFVNDNTLTVTMKRLREKLSCSIIKTIRGIGYLAEEEHE